ncbi:hypothetical protein HMPREF0987_01036 [Lachnospiraceae bacterium 9_1_43BFAA]|nr:hypothetical protein HMPREF0987_01036 [Lachnospiraceae bacterium 9_1_43BFAA]
MRLEDVCTVFTDGDWIESKDQSEKGIRLVQTGNIGEGIYLEKESRAKYIPEDTFKRLKCTEIFPGDILVSRLPEPVGRACIIPEKTERMITAVDCTICRPDEALISKDYLCYFMRSNAYYMRLLGNVTGTTRKRISRKNLGNVELKVPTKEEQKTVVERLDCLVKVIDSRTKELQLLDDLIKARFVEMFGNPRINPNKYPTKLIKDTCIVITGNTPSRKVHEYYGDAIEWIKTDNIVSSLLYPTVASESLSDSGKAVGRAVDAGAILMACIAGSVASIGRVCITDREVAFNQQINAIVPKEYDVRFLHALLQISKDYLVEDINMSLKGIISKSKLEEKEFIVPSMEEQVGFADFVKQIDKSKVAIQAALDKTQLLFDSLMQKYFG